MSHTALIVYFDTETTGLCWDCELVSFALKEDGEEPSATIRDRVMTERELLQNLSDTVFSLKERDRDLRFVTHFGESYYDGGFDFPFLRMRFMQNEMTWPFSNAKHFDTYPLVKKRICTRAKIPVTVDTLESLDANKLSAITTGCRCKPMGVAKATKADNIKALRQYVRDGGDIPFEEYEVMPEEKDINKLDYVYEILGGPKLGVEDLDGSKFPAKWAEYLSTGDEALREHLAAYNASDVVQLEYVYRRITDYFSFRDRNNWMDL